MGLGRAVPTRSRYEKEGGREGGRKGGREEGGKDGNDCKSIHSSRDSLPPSLPPLPPALSVFDHPLTPYPPALPPSLLLCTKQEFLDTGSIASLEEMRQEAEAVM